jgi:hypothetical protein
MLAIGIGIDRPAAIDPDSDPDADGSGSIIRTVVRGLNSRAQAPIFTQASGIQL